MELQNPYYAVIFTSIRTEGDHDYNEMANKMVDLARQQPGFLDVESARDGLGITVSYWESLEAIALWKSNVEHQIAQKKGIRSWYSCYRVRICRVERDYEFKKNKK
ncbi:antibiotic biosynthesis monooxygenase [Muricauda sp. JGD-17]|uniref:Antibiotic biosynthesis monooxygenase n=1 Tax=Flagellimonas ochracea TaxID=2696472 RepID=A0A964TD78_9FLAO|nr:antibiotic biosynthesis monooxygenase [Allomuricauda ochracea]NAY91848.1 antibiotic biosynthesis monooxygenase [Allomuricauda ochracea]